MTLPHELPPDALNECGYLAFDHYNWRDISCNFGHSGFHIPWNPTVFCLYGATCAAAVLLAVQVIIRTTLRFRRRDTLYFWYGEHFITATAPSTDRTRSLIGVALGIILYTLAFILRTLVTPNTSPAFPIPYTFAQLFVLTGFGLVMYSRLHLITRNPRVLHSMLVMIILVAVVGHTTTFIQLFVISLRKELLSIRIYHAVAYLDVIFTAQDLVLSSLYILFFWKHLRDASEFATESMKRRDHTTFRLLILANAVVLLVDVVTNTLLCLKIYLARSMVLPLLCVIKLEVELLVLDRLVKTAGTSSEDSGTVQVHTSDLGSKCAESQRETTDAEEIVDV